MVSESAGAMRNGAKQRKRRKREVASPAIDRTVKLYIGGKQARPDSGYSVEIRGKKGKLLGESPLGNRKDIRNAVEAARKAEAWGKTTAHNRAQVLYYIAENLSQRSERDHETPGSCGGEEAGGGGSASERGEAVFLRGMGGQVRWSGAQSSDAECVDRDERSRSGRLV